MFSTVELREIRVFLTLADELHFGRAADRLALTPSRVSQIIRTLETQIGGKLFARTSRHVQLTPVGEQLRRDLAPVYAQLERALSAAREAAIGPVGEVRVGMYVPGLGGAGLIEVVQAFEADHPGCTASFVDTGLVRSQLEWLRSGEVDLLVTRLPISEPDITIGPILTSEHRVAVVARTHPLAGRASISYEDLAPYPVSDAQALPREMMDAFIPPRTPCGQRLRRANVSTVAEAIMQAAVGAIVHPTVPSVLEQLPHPGVTAIPIRDLPPSETALIWLKEGRSATVKAFVETAMAVLGTGEDRLGARAAGEATRTVQSPA